MSVFCLPFSFCVSQPPVEENYAKNEAAAVYFSPKASQNRTLPFLRISMQYKNAEVFKGNLFLLILFQAVNVCRCVYIRL